MKKIFSAILLFMIFVFENQVFANENKISVIKSYQGKHILRVPLSDYNLDQNVIITNNENVSATYKITRVDKSKRKILIVGPSYVNLSELCKKNCQISSSSGSLMDEFSVGTSVRAPASK